MGAQTTIAVGIDWRAKVAIEIRTSRLAKVTASHQQDRNDLRELTRKKDPQKTKKHKEMINSLKKKVQKGRELIEKLTKYLEAATTSMNYDTEAKIFVHDKLSPNVKLEVGGVSIPVAHEVLEVEVSAKRVRGSHIQPMQTKKKASEDKEDKADKEDKKAS